MYLMVNILSRCLMRPREFINAVSKCRGYAVNRRHERIEMQDISDGLKDHSRDLVEEISLEVRDVFPQVSDAVYLFIGAPKVIDYDSLILRFIDHGVVEENWARLIDVLLWYGVLGYAKDTEESVYIYDTSFNIKLLKGLAGQFSTRGKLLSINPAFWAGLQLAEEGQSALIH
jgi:hypothetical protein